jgi:hypothetical protein
LREGGLGNQRLLHTAERERNECRRQGDDADAAEQQRLSCKASLDRIDIRPGKIDHVENSILRRKVIGTRPPLPTSGGLDPNNAMQGGFIPGGRDTPPVTKKGASFLKEAPSVRVASLSST